MQVFSDECEYLLHLVRCAIHDLQPQELPEGLLFGRVYECGVYHHVANIAFYSVERLTNKPEVELYRKWEDCRNMAVVRHINQIYAAQEIREGFLAAGIRWIEVQGTRIKPLYPQPEWRTMSDIDFIIDRENLPEAAEILKMLGYICKDSHGVEVDGFRSPNINVEIHTEYFPEASQYYSTMRPPFASVEETGAYDANEFYLYNILHIAKHYFLNGCGIRRVLDAYYLNKNYSQIIDGSYIKSILERANAADFAAELAELANTWFGMEEQDFPKTKMARFFIQSGLHGTRANELKNHLAKTFDSTVRFAKLKYFLRRVLGTPKNLRKDYPVLERYIFLYPFCWLYRTFRALKPQKLKRLRKEVEAVMNTKTTDESKPQT